MRELRSRGRPAFTLVELIIVMLVIGILAVVAAPRYADSIMRFRAEAAARRIAADLNLVRQNAITRSGGSFGAEWVRFYSSSDRYQLTNDADIDRPTEEYWVDFDETPYPVDLVSAAFTNKYGYTSNSIVKYDMHGVAKSGLPPFFPDAQLTSGTIVVAVGNEQRTVVIDPVTGEASVQ